MRGVLVRLALASGLMVGVAWGQEAPPPSPAPGPTSGPELQTHPPEAQGPADVGVAQTTGASGATGFDPKALRAWAVLKEYSAEGKSDQERIQALAALGTMGNDPTAAHLIEEGMKAHHGEVKTAAILAAEQTRNKALQPRMEAMLDDEEPDVAYAAALALWRLRDDAGIDLLEAVAQGDKKVTPGLMRTSKHKMTKELHDPKALTLIAVNGASGYFLGPFGIGLKAIEYAGENKGSQPRAQAIDQIAQHHSDEVKAILIDLLDDKEATVRAAAAKGLGRWPGQDTANKLDPLMKDDKLPVKLQAAAAYIKVTGNIATPEDCRCGVE